MTAIVIAGCNLGLLANLVAPVRLPVVRPPGALAGVPELTLDRAKSLHLARSAVFVDIRAPSDFAKGHIRGALSVRLNDPSSHEAVKGIARDTHLVLYCSSGSRCRLPRLVAAALERKFGFRRLSVFYGFREWKAAGLPVDVHE